MLCRPLLAINKVRKLRRFTPAQCGTGRRTAAAQQMQMNTPVPGAGLGAARLGFKVQRPVAGLPVVDASVFKLRQSAQHGLPRRGHQERPLRQLGGSKLAPLPDLARRIHQQVPAILAAHQDRTAVRQCKVPSGAGKEYSRQMCAPVISFQIDVYQIDDAYHWRLPIGRRQEYSDSHIFKIKFFACRVAAASASMHESLRAVLRQTQGYRTASLLWETPI